MRTRSLLSMIVLACACSVAAAEPEPLSLALPPELAEAGWTIREYDPPSKLPFAQGATQGFDFTNDKLTRTVPRKDGTEATVNAWLSFWVYHKGSVPVLLKGWDESYDWQFKNYEKDLKSSPSLAVEPKKPESLLFWRSNDYVLLLFEDEVGFPESELVKAAIKRQLLDR